MRSPDEVLMDDVVQPIVDRLPEGVSCFRAARISLAAGMIWRLVSTPLTVGFGLFHIAVFPLLWLVASSMISDAESLNGGQSMCRNTFRLNPVVQLLTWFWLAEWAIALCHHQIDLWDPLMAAVFAFVRADPRPPGTPRTTWLPAMSIAIPQGAA